MARDHSGESSVQQQARALRDAFNAGRDVNITVHQAAPPALARKRAWVNVPPRNRAFMGREGLLLAVRDALATGDQAVVQALHGMGGVGKTQLAIEYVHRFGQDYDVLLWVNAESTSLIGDQFALLGTSMGWTAPSVDVAVMRTAVLDELRQRDRWLLVFDNAESPEDITGWLPGGGGHVLVTSRASGWDEVAIMVEVDVLARPESVAILRGRVRGLSEADADRVAEVLGDLPLAVAQAAGYMAETGIPAAEYAALVAERGAEILNEGRPPSYRRSLAAVTELALERLRGADPAAAELAGICAFLAPEPVPAEWFVAAAGKLPASLGVQVGDPVAWRRVLAALGRSALARVDGGELVMHRLTQAVIRGHLPAGQDATSALAGAVLAANHPGDRDLPDTWPHWARVLPHLLAVKPEAASDANVRQLAVGAAWYLARRGDARASYELAGRLRDQWRSRLGPDSEHTLAAATAFGSALRGLGRWAEAREVDEDTLARCRRVLGADHSSALTSAGSVAIDLHALGEYGAARVLDEDTLARKRRVLGEDHPDTLWSATNLAVDLRGLGEYEAARALDEDVLTWRRGVLGEDHPDTLWSAGSLSADLYALRDYGAARVLDEDTLARRRRVLGEDHPDTLRSATSLAGVLRGLGEHGSARALDEDTLARRRRMLGEDHPDTQQSARNLARDLEALDEV